MNDFVCDHLEKISYLNYKNRKKMKFTNKEFEEFILKADLLTQEHNGITLGEIYMTVLRDNFPKLYDEIHDTELNVSLYRENIPLLFKYLMS